MKRIYILVSVILASSGAFAFSENPTIVASIVSEQKAGVDVTITVNSNGTVVKGALVKIVADKTVIGAGTTSESGSVSISIPTYGDQIVTIEVYHSLYKIDKLADIKLENAKAYSFNLTSKGDSAEEIALSSEASVAKTQTQIDKEKAAAAEAAKQKEEAIQKQNTSQAEKDRIRRKTKLTRKQTKLVRKRLTLLN
jgi:hypothetical protein